MAKALKLYKVCTGCMDSNGIEIQNWSSKTVLAHAGEEAIRKAKKHFTRREYVESVDLVSNVEVA